MAQDGLMHHPSVAVQPDPRVTPTSHGASFPILSEKRLRCRRGARPSQETGSPATAPSQWEARGPCPGRTVPREAWGQLSRPRRPTVVWGLWRRFSHRHARTASACGSCSLGSRPGDRRGPERPLRPCGPPRPQRRLHLEAAARGRRGGHPGSWQLRAARCAQPAPPPVKNVSP